MLQTPSYPSTVVHLSISTQAEHANTREHGSAGRGVERIQFPTKIQ